jgi:cation transport regulator ChaC
VVREKKESGMAENDQDQQYQSEDDQPNDEVLCTQAEEHKIGGAGEVVPGVSVVRGNTPRLYPSEALLAVSEPVAQEQARMRAAFPVQAPSAPPLPEELEDDEDDEQEQAITTTEVSGSVPLPQEFVWLFEYGLEMESAFLNSTERLNGAAFLYGPAVLRGYTLMFVQEEQDGHFLCSIVPYAQSGTEVWGVLYRVPRHVTVHNNGQLSVLDRIHAAGTSASLFAPVAVTVRETYHEREIACGTYALTTVALQQLRLLTPEQADSATRLVRRIASLARNQRLPSYYLAFSSQAASLATSQARTSERTSEVPVGKSVIAVPLPREQDTDPLPIMKGKDAPSALLHAVQRPANPPFARWLVVLSVYLIIVLLLVLAFAVVQGIGFASRFLTLNLRLLEVPWLVLIYGVLGGNLSCIVALGRARHLKLPFFVLMLWFVRPLVGGVLALFVYLFLNSGLFTIVDLAASHPTLFPLLGALAGFCEGRLFARWK